MRLQLATTVFEIGLSPEAIAEECSRASRAEFTLGNL
jgi:hypothetical protein